mgnify:CR=1 FL=1
MILLLFFYRKTEQRRDIPDDSLVSPAMEEHLLIVQGHTL